MISILGSLGNFWNSSIGKKWIVAITGAMLCIFVLGHMVGNLLVFVGRETLNDYAYLLKHSLHGAGVWIARFGLLGAVGLHIVATIQLTMANRAARESRYARPQKALRSSGASRWMIVSGSIILAFIGIHLAHFTLPLGQESREWMFEGKHDVYRMVIEGFRNPLMVIIYIVSIGMLCWHLSHGVASIFQTLGLSTPKTAPMFKLVGLAYAGIVMLGNTIMPLSILFGLVGGDIQ